VTREVARARNGIASCTFGGVRRLSLIAAVLVGCQQGRPLPADNLPVTRADRAILERADAILAAERVWNRNDTRDCPAGETQWSLFCALHDASLEVLGTYEHRRAALQEVRFVIDERKRDYPHRLMGFNNDPTTTFDDVKSVLHVALERVNKRLGRD
jgi:hypothetical protein